MIKDKFPWLNMLKVTLKYPPEFRYWPRMFIYHLIVLLQHPFHWLELILWKAKIEQHQLPKDPIILLGYWRSGTTYLQRLLALNEELAYIKQYEMLLPLGSPIHAKLFKRLVDVFFRITGMKHPSHGVLMSVDFPSEEDIGLTAIAYPYTPMLSHVYSKYAEAILEEQLFSTYGDKASKLYMDMHLYLAKRQSYFNQGKQLLLKSPSNTTKVAELLELYPNAKFVYIQRDPRDVYFSNIKLFTVNEIQWLQKMPTSQMNELFLKMYPRTLASYENLKERIPKGNLIEIQFEDLCKHPKASIKNISDQFGLSNWEKTSKKLDAYILENHEKKRHFYKGAIPKDILEMFESIDRSKLEKNNQCAE